MISLFSLFSYAYLSGPNPVLLNADVQQTLFCVNRYRVYLIGLSEIPSLGLVNEIPLVDITIVSQLRPKIVN